MASTDPLHLLRASVAASNPPKLTTSSTPDTAAANLVDNLIDATHLYFSSTPTGPQCHDLSSPTRFISTTLSDTAVDLRSIYFAWQQKDQTVPEYIAAASELQRDLPEGQNVRHLVFVERIDLLTWLEGASEESEYIKPFKGESGEGEAKAAAAAVPTLSGTGVGVTQQSASGRPVKIIDARLQEIYNGERKMGDRNTVLRGIKPTDFSHVRKAAEIFLGKSKHRSAPIPNPRIQPSAALTSRPAISNSKRADPIILLSPSASSLLRMSNIKSFLDSGLFVPASHPTLANSTPANLLHITRTLPKLSPRPFRFILVDSPDQFKPDYWNRVVAVFTTGQIWQFRGYKWREPQELFGHVLGIFVSERNSPTPSEVLGWGSNVRKFQVDRWDERGQGANVDAGVRDAKRWRDREVVEEVWRTVEQWMASKGSEWRR